MGCAFPSVPGVVIMTTPAQRAPDVVARLSRLSWDERPIPTTSQSRRSTTPTSPSGSRTAAVLRSARRTRVADGHGAPGSEYAATGKGDVSKRGWRTGMALQEALVDGRTARQGPPTRPLVLAAYPREKDQETGHLTRLVLDRLKMAHVYARDGQRRCVVLQTRACRERRPRCAACGPVLQRDMPWQKSVTLRRSGLSPGRLTRAGSVEPPFYAGLARPSTRAGPRPVV
jgi:hypothetical protein